MKGKKSFAALAAVIMTVSAVSVFPGTAFADGEQAQTDSGAAVSYGNETGSAVMQAAGSPDFSAAHPAGGIQAYTLGRSTSAADGLDSVMEPDEYAALTPEQQAEYVMFTTDNKNIICETDSDENGNYFNIYNGFYVKKGTNILISVLTEKYVGHDILVNGEILEVEIDFGLEYNLFFGNEYQVGDSDVNVTMKERALTDWEKENFIPVTKIGENVSVYKADSSGYYDIFSISEGDYISRFKSTADDCWYYVIVAPADTMANKYFNVCGDLLNYSVNSDNEAVKVISAMPENNEEFTVEIAGFGSKYVVTEEEYAALSPEQQATYAQFISKNKDINALLMGRDNEFSIPVNSSDYVVKTYDLFVSVQMEEYVGKDIVVNGEVIEALPSGDNISNFGGAYYVTGDKIVADLTPRTVLTDYEKQNFIPVTKLDEGVSVYKVMGDTIDFRVEIEPGTYINLNRSGNSALRYAIRVPAETGEGKGVCVCGNDLSYYINWDNEIQVWGVDIPENASQFTVELTDREMCRVTADNVLYDMRNFTGDITAITDYIGSADTVCYVPKGATVYLGVDPAYMTGYNFTVNGTAVETLSGDQDQYYYAFVDVDSAETVIGRQIKAELSDYEMENTVALKADNGIKIFDYVSQPVYHIDQCHLVYGDGDRIVKGRYVMITVSEADYSGKEFKVDGLTETLESNGEGLYTYWLTIPEDADTLTLSLETVSDKPSVPDTPAAPSRPSTPYIPAAPAAPVAPSAGGTVPSGSTSGSGEKKVTEKSVVKNINKSKRKNISFNAEDTGISSDILTAFTGNKKAQTLTADYGNFSIIISKNDISGSTSEGFDINVSSRKIISEKKLKPLNGFKNARKIVQLNITGSKPEAVDRFTVKAEAGDKLAGKTATVYEYLGGGKLRTVGSGKVDKNGNVSFKTDHIGKYIIAVK